MDSFARNRPLRVRRRLTFVGLGISVYVFAAILGRVPGLTDAVYGNLLGPWIARILSTVTGLVPFSLAEPCVAAAVAWEAVPAARGVWDVWHERRAVGNALLAGALKLGQDAGILVTTFYLLWGFHYARAPLERQVGWTEVRQSSIDELAALAEQLVAESNSAYHEIHGGEDAGVPTTFPRDDQAALEAALVKGWEAARLDLGLAPVRGSFGRVKRLFATRIYEVFGVVGFYFPFTGEANVRAGVPASELPQSVAHEKAHQRGIALESEANFWGFLSGAYAPHAHARYSAYLFAQYQLLAALARADSSRRRAITAMRLPGVQRDVDSARAYWLRLRGPGTEVGRVVNDAFLRSNRVPGGVRSYSRSARLFIAYARANNGRLVPQRREGGA